MAVWRPETRGRTSLKIKKEFTMEKAICNYVMESDFGNNKEGEVVALDQEKADALVAAGVVREATAEDMGGEPDGDEVPPEEGKDEDETEPEMASASARSVEDVVTKAVAKTVAKLAKKTAPTRPLQVPTNRHVKGSDEVRTGGFKNLGDAVMTMVARSKGDYTAARKIARHQDLVTKATGMSIGGSSGHQGGDLVPQEWASDLWRLSFEFEPDLLSMCRRYEMHNQVENIPAWSQTSPSSGVTAAVIGEASSITATVGTTTNVQLSLVKGAALVNISDELLRFNAYNLTTVLEQIVPERIRFLVNDGVINGTNSQINLVGNAAAVVVTRAANSVFSYQDIVKMRSHLHTSFRKGASWLVNPSSVPALMSLAFPTQNATTPIPVFVPGGFGNSLESEPLGKLLGLPIYEAETCPGLGSKGDLILWHPGSCAAGYTGLIADSTPYLYFDLAQNSFRFMFYYDTVNPMLQAYRRPDNSDASNIVILSGVAGSGE